MSTTPPHESDLPVPTYSATDDGDLLNRIERATAVEFPILHSPIAKTTNLQRLTSDSDWTSYHEAYRLERDIVDSFFTSIENGHDDLVAEFISRGWVSPDTTSRVKETPLLAAVRAGKTPMVSRLVALGATVNAFGRPDTSKTLSDDERPERTPLMLAAERGHLALVKVLVKDYGADDGLVAPDGAIALRLAAINGHREIVDFLPSRRGGAWLRWKAAHHKQMERIRRAWNHIGGFLKVLFWDCPVLLFCEIPKELAKGIWKRRHRMAAACKRMAKELPAQIVKGVVELPGNIKRCGKAVWEGIKEIPPILKAIAVAIWKTIKEIPGAVMVFLKWIGRGFKRVGEAIIDVFSRLLSLLHTAIMAVVSFFKNITLQDIWDGFCSLVRAIFVDAPKAIGAFIKSFGQMTYDILKALFGTLGQCVWYLVTGILWLIQYVPHRIWTIFEALGTSIVRGYQEMMSYLNPKRM
ncbi:uncharacterized protein NECHADRAFT_77006 [Fusarium vanettenii 77-13-4]|uniref:Uncharacterized protein n=1 Tax=Fusarium vanettenii (strain ATCC MYA-4622 / CBS 123669 / FGSC 9596 / NRRL 45880 / 77-13-4) TaxID=660122 RepID=C7ZCC8_FUSV7|nr:uncharacterized protein NECHADRAFT_77006 [Fusarium vanettenii 77-13-4]EEU38237.1 hypothetical protein NECHADRAFT_77006 [Fusarium vanettenii 77-13-4]